MSVATSNGQEQTDAVVDAANVAADNTADSQATSDTNIAADSVDGGQSTVEGGNADSVDGGQQTEKNADGTDKVADTKTEEKPTGAPEAYEFKAPDGVEYDKEVLAEFEGIAKELNLSQENAQKLVELGPKLQQKFVDQQAEVVKDVQAKWTADTKADKEIGGEGEALNANLAIAKTALEKFGSPALKTLLVDSGLGNHPEVIRVFHRIGKAISNDTLVNGRQTEGASKSLADKLYTNPTSSPK